MRVCFAGAIIVAVSLMSVAVVAQLVQPVPGPGSGIVTVAGTVSVANTPSVNIANAPSVNAAQAGAWKVTLANTPAVSLTPPEFLRPHGRYDIVWASGQRESITVLQLGSGGWGGWVKVQTSTGRTRWINVAGAATVEELP